MCESALWMVGLSPARIAVGGPVGLMVAPVTRCGLALLVMVSVQRIRCVRAGQWRAKRSWR